MKVILLSDLKGNKRKGDIIEVSDGYAVNYLIPKKLAKIADNKSINELKNQEKALQYKKEVQKEENIKIKEIIDNKEIDIYLSAGENGKLFGSVTSKNISEAINEKYNVNVDKHSIDLSEPIKSFGRYNIDIKLDSEIFAKVILNVSEKV